MGVVIRGKYYGDPPLPEKEIAFESVATEVVETVVDLRTDPPVVTKTRQRASKTED